MENTIIIGKIVKPQGIRGELKVLPLADSPDIFCDLKKIYIEGKEYGVVSARIGDGVFLALRGIADRNAAELLRDKFVYAARSDITLPEGRWFIADVIGCNVCLDDGEELGKVADITTRGSTDIYTVDLGSGKGVAFPLLKEMIVKFDVSGREIILEKKRFKEVALYED